MNNIKKDESMQPRDLEIIIFILACFFIFAFLCGCGEMDCEAEREACLTHETQNNCNVLYSVCIHQGLE